MLRTFGEQRACRVVLGARGRAAGGVTAIRTYGAIIPAEDTLKNLVRDKTAGPNRTAIRLFAVALFVMLGPSAGQVEPGLIMSWEEYSRQPRRAPYILKFSAATGELLYYGARHTFSPDDPQVAEIERLWNEFRPTLAFSEGGVRPASTSLQEAVRRYGEPGLVRVLADRRRIPIRSIEPPQDEEIRAMLREWPPDRVKLYYFLRAIMGYRRGTHEQPVEDYAESQLRILNRTPGLGGPPRTITEVQTAIGKLSPPLADWRAAPESWFNPTRSEAFTNEFSRKLNLFRDEHMLKNLVGAVLSGERVFAVVGSGHVIMQERALRAALR